MTKEEFEKKYKAVGEFIRLATLVLSLIHI